jgi:T5SS/PEP-CTERM-associated repeat protein
MLPKRLSSDPMCLLFSLLLTAIVCCSVTAAITDSGSVSGTAPGGDPIIGISDIGRLTINGGSTLTSDMAIIGDLLNGVGLVTVTDFNSGTDSASRWTTTSLMVGDEGIGRLEILNGAIVTVDVAANPGIGDLFIGNDADSQGTIIVNGFGSQLRMGDDSTVGLNGTGILRIENDGQVIGTNDLGTDTFSVGVHGRIELAGGRLRSEVLTNNGVIIGSGRLDNAGAIVNSGTGHIEVRTADRLVINAPVTNQGEIVVLGGELEFFDPVTSSVSGAEVTLRDGGQVEFPTTGFGYDSTAGTLASTAGINDIYGTVRIQGLSSKLVVTGRSTAIFHDPVTNAGGTIEVFPGSTPVYLQGLTTTGSTAVLSLHLTDPEEPAELGQVDVVGTAQLAGKVAIQLGAGYHPRVGDAFQVLTASQVIGTLDLGTAPALLGGMIWEIDVNPTNVLLSVVATGDYNGNGVVDAADYVVWRETQGQSGDRLAADANGDRMVDTADYEFWRARFGNVVTAGSGAMTAVVPEPVSKVMLLLGVVCALCRSRSVRSATIAHSHGRSYLHCEP